MSFLSNQNSSFCILGVPMCLIFVELLLWCFTFESQFCAFAWCAVDRNQIHKIWIIPQFSWRRCRSVVSFCNCTCLAPGANSFDEQNSAKRHHLSPGSPVSWSPSPPPPKRNTLAFVTVWIVLVFSCFSFHVLPASMPKSWIATCDWRE